MNYNIDFFIDFYEKTKEEDWCVERFAIYFPGSVQRCALGFCEVMDGDNNYTQTRAALWGLNNGIAIINDGHDPNYQQPTAKQRVLAALYDIKKSQYPELSTVTVEDIINEALTV